jgi:hypothetical protein
MTPSTTSPLEKLPLLILERICEYLDDDSERRRSLWAFSLTSSCCCAAAVAQRFCQIQLKIHAPEELDSSLKRWTEVLTPDGRHRHVRRFKVSWATTEEEERRKKGLSRQDEEADDEEGEENDDANSNLRHYFDTHNFCRPSKSCLQGSGGGSITDHPEAWVSLSRFISQLSGLQDLVWAYGSHIPQSVLSVVSARGSRLHMHCFHLSSLVQQRDNPQPIDPDDYALVTSPCLYSIVVRLVDFETDGMLNYTKEAVMRMVAGTAPNLAHVCLMQTMAGDSLAHREAIRLGKPAWSGFLSPGTVKPDQLQGLGSLQSLVFTGYPCRDIDSWARFTDFAKLRGLIMPWSLRCGVALAEMATSGNFESLDTLGLSGIEDETDQAQEALIRLLESLHPLQRLELSGYISNEAFDVVLRRHGGALRNLSIDPYRDNESQNPLVVFSEATVRRLAEQCPSLEQVRLPVNRTRGDNQETGIYRALSRLPRLRCAFLRLLYSVGPDEEFWDDERDGEYPLSFGVEAEEIPSAFLREAFSNSAIDATLALSIFNLISSGGSLRYLRLEPRRKMGPNAPAPGYVQFENVLRWFSRSWVCKRDIRGEVTVRELDKKGTASAGEEWKYLSEETQYNGEEIYQEVFKEIWPQKTPEWWKDWKSLPLFEEAA